MPQRRRRDEQKTGSCYCVVDPGTTALRVLLAEIQDGQAVVWGWAQVAPVDGVPTGSLAMACEEALHRAERMAQERAGRWLMADQMIVGLPAAALRGRAWPVDQRRARPERPIEEHELAALLERALRLAVNRLVDDAGWRLLDAAVVALTVEGRGVTDPVAFKGRELGAAVFAAVARVEQIGAWSLVAQRLEFSALTLTAAPLAVAAGLSVPQAVLVDVGGATTDLISCHAGLPLAIESVAAGGAELTRALVQAWGLAPARAEQLKRLYVSSRLPAEANPQVREVLLPAVGGWFRETELALARLNPDEPLPQWLVLTGGGSLVPEVTEAVRALAWSEHLHFARHPEVARLSPTDLPGVVNRTDGGRAAGDVTALALAAWAARQSRPAGRPARLLGELCHAGSYA